jgi:uncharacterized protein YegJ (DUF2314 family)
MRTIAKSVIAIALSCLFVSHGTSEERVPIVRVPAQDPAMAAAFSKAHATLDDFLAKLARPAAGTAHYAVKVGIKDGSGSSFVIMRPGDSSFTEYFWIGDIRRNGDTFTGFVHNDPEFVHNIRLNQEIHFSRDDIADWTYFDHDQMKGNFTACPALVHSPQAMAEMRERFGLVCL